MTAVGLDREDAYHPAHELGLKMLCAGIANAVGSMVTNPADLTKVRQQLYIKQAAERLSPSFPATLVRMVREEGLLSLYKGLTASMCREMSYSSIRMGMYDLFKTSITKANPRIDQHSMAVKLLAGMGSGCLGAAVANPADLVKVRLQAAGNTMTLPQHVLDIYRRQGIVGYWRGVVPTVFRAGILTSSQLGSYDGTKQFFKREMPKQFPEGFRTHLICSGIAGLVCSVASAPVDTIKVRMMNDSKSQYKNAIHATALLLRYEGPLALYKGFFGCWIRLWPQTVISLITMEKLRKIVGLNPI